MSKNIEIYQKYYHFLIFASIRSLDRGRNDCNVFRIFFPGVSILIETSVGEFKPAVTGKYEFQNKDKSLLNALL